MLTLKRSLAYGAGIAVGLLSAVATHAAGVLPVATSTLNDFLDDNFQLGFTTILYVLGVIWPYLIVVGIVWIFWKIARSFFHR